MTVARRRLIGRLLTPWEIRDGNCVVPVWGVTRLLCSSAASPKVAYQNVCTIIGPRAVSLCLPARSSFTAQVILPGHSHFEGRLPVGRDPLVDFQLHDAGYRRHSSLCWGR